MQSTSELELEFQSYTTDVEAPVPFDRAGRPDLRVGTWVPILCDQPPSWSPSFDLMRPTSELEPELWSYGPTQKPLSPFDFAGRLDLRVGTRVRVSILSNRPLRVGTQVLIWCDQRMTAKRGLITIYNNKLKY